MAAAIAVQGVCAVTKGIKETIALENVKRLHRQVAEQRHGSLPRQIERARRCHDDAAMTLLQHNGHPFRASEIKKTFEATANLLETELCQYRDLRFRLDMLLWLQDEYEAWLEGRLYSDTPMPTMGQATIAAIYLVAGKKVHACRINTPEAIPEMIQAAQPSVSKDNLRAELSKFGDEHGGLDFSKFPNGKDFISAFEILAVIDTQMAAVLEYYSLDADPLAEARAEAGPDAEDSELDVDKVTCYRLYGNICYNSTSEEYPQIHAALENNPVACKSLACFEAFFDMLDKCKRGLTMGLINGLLIAAGCHIALLDVQMVMVLGAWRLGGVILYRSRLVYQPLAPRHYAQLPDQVPDDELLLQTSPHARRRSCRAEITHQGDGQVAQPHLDRHNCRRSHRNDIHAPRRYYRRNYRRVNRLGFIGRL